MGQNSSKTLQGANKLNIDASDSYITEIGMRMRKGTIPISEIIKMEKYNKLKQKVHVHPKKKKNNHHHQVVIYEEKSNVKDTNNCRKESRQNNIPAKYGDEVIRNYPRMRSGGGQNNNLDVEHAQQLQKDLLQSPTKKDALREVYKNYEYPEKSIHKKNQNKTLQRKSSNENHAMKTVMNTEKREEQVSKDKEDEKKQKTKRFVIETNVSCIVPSKHIYYDERRTDQNREISCENSRCPCKRHECPYLKKQLHQFASITAMSQEDIRFRRQQANHLKCYENYHGRCEFINKMNPRQQRYASIVSISEENLRGRNYCREHQCRRNDRSMHRMYGNDEERAVRRHQERRHDTYPTKRNAETKVLSSPKEALENWKKMHTLRQQRHQSKLKEPSDEMVYSNYESHLKYGRNEVMNNGPTVQKIWPTSRKCCIRRTSSMTSNMLEHDKDCRHRDGIHADLERCLLQHAKRRSSCRENECRNNKSTWVQDRHRKWHKVVLND